MRLPLTILLGALIVGGIVGVVAINMRPTYDDGRLQTDHRRRAAGSARRTAAGCADLATGCADLAPGCADLAAG